MTAGIDIVGLRRPTAPRGSDGRRQDTVRRREGAQGRRPDRFGHQGLQQHGGQGRRDLAGAVGRAEGAHRDQRRHRRLRGRAERVRPGLSGQSQSQATTTLKSLGLGTQVVTNYSTSGVAKGQVADQFPSAGTSVPPGTIVGLVVSGGPIPSGNSTATVSVASVVGKTSSFGRDDAQESGAQAGRRAVERHRPAAQPGRRTDSRLGAVVPKNSSVLIFVSNGK